MGGRSRQFRGAPCARRNAAARPGGLHRPPYFAAPTVTLPGGGPPEPRRPVHVLHGGARMDVGPGGDRPDRVGHGEEGRLARVAVVGRHEPVVAELGMDRLHVGFGEGQPLERVGVEELRVVDLQPRRQGIDQQEPRGFGLGLGDLEHHHQPVVLAQAARRIDQAAVEPAEAPLHRVALRGRRLRHQGAAVDGHGHLHGAAAGIDQLHAPVAERRLPVDPGEHSRSAARRPG